MAGQGGVRACSDHLGIKCRAIKRPRAGTGQNMLAQHIARAGATGVSVKRVGHHGFQRRLAFHHLKPVGGHQQRLGRRVVAVVCPTDALNKALDVLGRAHLDHQINIAPVQPQIQRPRANHSAQLASNHRRFHPFALFARQRTVVNPDGQGLFIRQPQIVKENLGLCAGVVEDQRDAVGFDLFQDCGDGVFAPTPRPRRRHIGNQHLNVRIRAGIGQQHLRPGG